MKRLVAIVALTAALALVTAPMAGAGAPDQGSVTLDIWMYYDTGTGPFTASGGIVCGSGDTQDEWIGSWRGVPPQFTGDYYHGASVLMKERKVFTCGDGTGTFTLEFIAPMHWDQGYNHGEWKVVAGTGDYTDLRGHGTFRVEWGPDVPNHEVWEGHLLLR
jgi:hypothetical protein